MEKRIKGFEFKIKINSGGKDYSLFLTTGKYAEELRKEILETLLKCHNSDIWSLINSRLAQLDAKIWNNDTLSLFWLSYEIEINNVFYMDDSME